MSYHRKRTHSFDYKVLDSIELLFPLLPQQVLASIEMVFPLPTQQICKKHIIICMHMYNIKFKIKSQQAKQIKCILGLNQHQTHTIPLLHTIGFQLSQPVNVQSLHFK